MTAMLRTLLVLLTLAAALAAVAAGRAEMTRGEALRSLEHAAAPERAAAVVRLGAVGTMADAPRVAARLRDADEGVRELAGAALWAIWSRSGDAAIDRLFAQGLEQMAGGRLE